MRRDQGEISAPLVNADYGAVRVRAMLDDSVGEA